MEITIARFLSTPFQLQSNDTQIAPSLDGTASGSLYLDDGESLVQPGITDIEFAFSASGEFSMDGVFDFDAGVSIESIVLLGVGSEPTTAGDGAYDSETGTMTYDVDIALMGSMKMQLEASSQ